MSERPGGGGALPGNNSAGHDLQAERPPHVSANRGRASVRRSLAGCLVAVLTPLNGQQSSVSTEELQKRLRNPFSKTVSLSYTNEVVLGSENGSAYIGTFQPLLPFTKGSITFLSRPAFSFARVSTERNASRMSTTGDLGYQLFLSPARSRSVIWGIGPAFVFPTASRDVGGSGKWSGGPAFGVAFQPWRLSINAEVTSLWSFAGEVTRPPIRQLTVEYGIDCRLRRGWSLTSNATLVEDWRGTKGERWSVPVGGGVTKTFNGRVPVQVSAVAYRNVVRPAFSSIWSLQISVTPVLALK
jgi:hypothetical protein